MYIVGIAGGSGSGKTTFAKKIYDRVDPEGLGIIHLDSYYLKHHPTHLKVHGEPNFDHPDSFDWDLLVEHLTELKGGGTAEVPVYDYKISKRLDQTTTLGPCTALIIEGLFTLRYENVRKFLDLKVFLSVDADIRFIRRLHRDVRERGRTLDGIIRQYYATVRPMHHQFLEPQRPFADVVVGEETDHAAYLIANHLSTVKREASK